MTRWFRLSICLGGVALLLALAAVARADVGVRETPETIEIKTSRLHASIRKRGYVSGVQEHSLVDVATGAHDLGYGLDIADWLMEPGSDESLRDQLHPELVYPVGDLYHGQIPKRSIEGPQICTKAQVLYPTVMVGKDFVAVRQSFKYTLAAPGRATGSIWTQVLVFPDNERYYFSMQRVDAANASDGMFLRVDQPGHLRHNGQGDTFSEIYLSYFGQIPASEFAVDFPPDARYRYVRDDNAVPERMIRAYRTRLAPPAAAPATDGSTPAAAASATAPGNSAAPVDGPWLAGMTLDPSMVSEAWCHQRGYVCLIEEIGGRPIQAGQSFSAAFITGYFDSIDEMHAVYDRYKGHRGLVASSVGWELVR